MAKKPKKRYYVVWRGLKPGIYPSWDKAKEQVSGYEGAEYKAFSSKTDAEEAFKRSYFEYKGKTTASKKEFSKKELEDINTSLLLHLHHFAEMWYQALYLLCLLALCK